MKPAIGIVGVGMMGHGIARNVLKHGYRLTALEHAGNQPLAELIEAGAKTQVSAMAVAASADIVLICVTGSPEVEAVLMGEGGVLQGLRTDAVVIDCSTAIPTSTERLAAAVKRSGGRFLDAAMTRTPKEAAEGRLNLLVGGEAALFAECRPLLECFAENITHVGPVGSGHRMKLLHNYVSLGFIALLAEAAACAERAGVARETFVDVLAKGGGGGIALERMQPYLLHEDLSGLRFSMANAHKDLGYYMAMATESDVARAIAQSVTNTYARGVHEGKSGSLVPELASILVRGG
jgi:3-hydroxyisobutyrate dehydrogenase-like beta-hydroxyacid dehydrogenase